jgi:hypothetical protein
MPRLRGTYLGVLVLGWLLSFGTQVAWGYYPYCTVTVTYDSHSVSYSVYNPQTQQHYQESFSTLGTVVNLQQHHNVVTWAVQETDGYHVGMTTFDPGVNSFQNEWQGPFTSVTQLQVVDGVVAYVVPSSTNPGKYEARYTTYDPAKGWQNNSYNSGDTSNLNLLVKDGVVVFYGNLEGQQQVELTHSIYDPKLGYWADGWNRSTFLHLAEMTALTISNATIYVTEKITDAFGTITYINWVVGYCPDYQALYMNPWTHSTSDNPKPTNPLPYFVAQPDFGKKPLWVWFTDMSIGGTSWNWNFGDNVTSSSRSTYHTFTFAGTFHVSQQINGNSTCTRDVIVVNTFGFKNNSSPAIHYLLLNNN